MSTRDFLLEMGFPEHRVDLALKETNNTGTEAAMDWLLSHPEETQSQDPENAAGTAMETSEIPENVERSDNTSSAAAKSLKCDECGKLFKNTEEVEFHAAKTNHSQFSESTEEKRPLTEEEKKEQLKKVEELLRQKRIEREEKEKQDAIEREKKRIQMGKDITLAKKRLEEEEIKRIAEEKRREKEEEKRARQRVKEQIEQDKLARKAKFGGQETIPQQQPTPVPAAPVVAAPKDYSETRIQVRLTNGATLTQSFKAKETLAAVRLFVEMNRTDSNEPFKMQTNFPRKVFSESDYETPLEALGLVPSAVIIISKA